MLLQWAKLLATLLQRSRLLSASIQHCRGKAAKPDTNVSIRHFQPYSHQRVGHIAAVGDMFGARFAVSNCLMYPVQALSILAVHLCPVLLVKSLPLRAELLQNKLPSLAAAAQNIVAGNTPCLL